MSGPHGIRITRAEGFPQPREGTVVAVSSARLPLLTFSRVKVRKEIRRELGVVERFALQAGLRLVRFQAKHLHEATSIPESALVRFLDQLARTNTLAALGGGHYEIHARQAERALAEEYIRELVTGSQDFLWLPRTDDLLAMPEGNKSFERLTRLSPVGQAPVPKQHRGLLCGEWLDRRISAGEVLNLSKDILGVMEGAAMAVSALPDLCPDYLCEGVVIESPGGGGVSLLIEGEASNKRPTHAQAELHLPPASRLCTAWRELAAMPGRQEHLEQVADAAGLRQQECRSARATGALDFSLAISPAAARRLFEERISLATPFGLTVRSEEGTCVETRARYEPADPAHAVPFAIDTAVVNVLQNGRTLAPAAATESAVQKVASNYALTGGQINAGSVMDRLWALGHFDFIYRARAEADFSYDAAD